MYNFVDTTEHTSTAVLPSEAMQFNGEYIENLIEGYRTLYVKGRDVLSPEIELGEVGVRDGGYLKNKRFPARTITIGYQLLASDEKAFRAKYNALNDILNTEDAQLIFADEPDKYFTGTPNGYDDIPSGRNNVTSEFEIICADPFKYSVEEYEVVPSADDEEAFVVEYNGTYPAYPTLEADFYQSDTEDNTDGYCGYVAFANDRGKVLQFGNAIDTDEITKLIEAINTPTTQITKSQRLINDTFQGAVTPWNNAGFFSNSNVNVRSGSIKTGVIGGGIEKAVQPSAYGSDSTPAWHGPTAAKNIGALPAISGASDPTRSADFTLSFKLRFAPNRTESVAKKQAGMFQAWVSSDSGYICGIQVWKNSQTNNGTVAIYVQGHGAVKTWTNVDLGHFNPYFGYKVPSPKMGVTFTKSGSKFTFNIGGLTFTFTATNMASVVATKLSFYFGKWKAVSPLDFLGVFAVQFTDTGAQYTVPTDKNALSAQLEQKHTFSTNDILIAHCEDATVWLTADDTTEGEGTERPDLGALGNDWEQFTLEKGQNQITTMYSDWVADAYKPTFKLRYRERYL